MSILSIRNLYNKILAPILLSPEKRGKEKDAKVILRRRVEVTVERETISIIVPGQRRGPTDQTASQERDFGVSRLELPAPPSTQDADSGQTEDLEKGPSD